MFTSVTLSLQIWALGQGKQKLVCVTPSETGLGSNLGSAVTHYCASGLPGFWKHISFLPVSSAPVSIMLLVSTRASLACQYLCRCPSIWAIRVFDSVRTDSDSCENSHLHNPKSICACSSNDDSNSNTAAYLLCARYGHQLLYT